MISVIIPTCNEADIISRSLEELHRPEVSAGIPFEVIVSDASATDDTAQEVRRYCSRSGNPVKLVTAPLGRGAQMNRGALEAAYPVLLFLHADVALPEGALAAVGDALARPDVVGGGFLKSYREDDWRLGLNVLLTRIRVLWFKSFWGNDCIFVRREAFEELGGYACWPLLEDVDFSKRMRKLGRTAAVRQEVLASARRYIKHGILRQGLRNVRIMIAYWLGKDPGSLKPWYEPDRRLEDGQGSVSNSPTPRRFNESIDIIDDPQ